MSKLICTKCHSQSPEGAFYCQHCAQPLSCKGCKALLLPNAKACIQCGLLIPERSSNEPLPVETASVLPGYSRLKIHETLEERDLDLIVANEAIEHLKDIFPSLAGNHPLGQFKNPLASQTQSTALVEVDSDIPSAHPQLPAAKGLHSSTELTEEQRIWEIFKEHDGRLVQEMLELKAVPIHKKSYIVRLATLYLYAKELKGEERVSREELFKILEDANVKDKNSSTYIYRSGIRLDEATGTLRLTLEARTKAQQYIDEIFNPEVPDGWRPGRTIRPSNGRAKKTVKRGGERHNKSDELIAEWCSYQIIQELNKQFPQNITGKFSVEDQALFGLYCLYKASITVEIQPTHLSKFLYQAFQLNVQADSIRFRKALKNKPPYVAKKDDSSRYRITPAGIAYIEHLLQENK